MSHTYALLSVSPATYEEIAGKLRDAGYNHAFVQERSGEVHIDMHGIGLIRQDEERGTSPLRPLLEDWAQFRSLCPETEAAAKRLMEQYADAWAKLSHEEPV